MVDPLRLSLAGLWRHRERVEREAARQFERLAAELARAGVPAALVDRAAAAATDEDEHAGMCRRIVDHLAPGLAPLAPRPVGPLGPAALPVERRALYASVALACVTETISTALLLEMRRLATDGLVRATVDRILRDEVRHGRLGWAHLAWAAARADVGWLAPHLAGMVRASLGDELPAVAAGADDVHPGQGQGVLAAARIHRVAAGVLADVIVPGLARHGIDTRDLAAVVAGPVIMTAVPTEP